MKILFVVLSPFDSNSSAMIRNKALIKGFLENNHYVEIIAMGSLNNQYSDITNSIKHENLIIKEIEAIKTYKTITSKNKGFLGFFKKAILLPIIRYVYHKINLYDSSVFLINKIDKNLYLDKYYDIVISSSDPKTSHIAVDKMISSGLKYGKWIQYWGDPLAIDITSKSIYPKFYKKYHEEKILNNADKIVYVSPLTLKEQKKEFKKFSKLMTWMPIPYMKEKIYTNRKYDFKSIKLGYFGDYKDAVRNIKNLYDVCFEEKLNLVIAGNSNKKYQQTDNIKIHERLPSVDVEKLESEVDVLVCILNIKGTQIPGKIYHYAATNKPILIILDGENKSVLYDYLNGFNRFVFCDNNNNDIKRCLKKISSNNLKYLPIEGLRYEKLSEDFLEIDKW